MPPGPSSIITKESYNYLIVLFLLSFTFIVFLSLQDLILATGKNKGSDNPLAFVGCEQLFCLCAGATKVVCVLPPTGSINLGS